MAHHRTHRQTVAVFDRGKIGNTVDVDEVRRTSEAQAQKWNEALPTGQHLGFVAVLPEKRDGFID